MGLSTKICIACRRAEKLLALHFKIHNIRAIGCIYYRKEDNELLIQIPHNLKKFLRSLLALVSFI